MLDQPPNGCAAFHRALHVREKKNKSCRLRSLNMSKRISHGTLRRYVPTGGGGVEESLMISVVVKRNEDDSLVVVTKYLLLRKYALTYSFPWMHLIRVTRKWLRWHLWGKLSWTKPRLKMAFL